MKRMVIALCVVILSVAVADGAGQIKNTTRRKLTRATASVKPAESMPTVDTIVPPDGTVTVSGFDKPQRSMAETAFVTNGGCRELYGVVLTLTYFDKSRRMLHKRTVKLGCEIPAGETRQLQWSAWDRLQSFNYVRSVRKRGGVSTPFDVECSVDSVIVGCE